MNLILTSCLPENKWAGVKSLNEMGRMGEEGSCNCVNKSIVSFSLPLFLTHRRRPWTISWEVRLGKVLWRTSLSWRLQRCNKMWTPALLLSKAQLPALIAQCFGLNTAQFRWIIYSKIYAICFSIIKPPTGVRSANQWGILMRLW